MRTYTKMPIWPAGFVIAAVVFEVGRTIQHFWFTNNFLLGVGLLIIALATLRRVIRAAGRP